MIITCDNITAKAHGHYAPIPIGNGDLSLPVDFEGCQKQRYHSLLETKILRAGIRRPNVGGELTSFGHFEFDRENDSVLCHWIQSLDTDTGMVKTHAEYQDGTVAESETLCSATQNILSLTRRYIGIDREWRFRYFLGDSDISAMMIEPGVLHYRMPGLLHPVSGEIRFSANVPIAFEYVDGAVTAWCTAPEAVIYIHYAQAGEPVQKFDHAELLHHNRGHWQKFWKSTPVNRIPQGLQKTYRMSLYHLAISTTRWSVPIGLFNSHWHGRYFAFDEYFIFQGLLSSNRIEEARRIVTFRFAGLDAALNRAGRYFGIVDGAARFPWETIENGAEGGGYGNPLDHIFHMANVALECFDFYRKTREKEFLRDKLYPVIRACAEFFLQQAINKDSDGQSYIGKFLDLERLGSARDHAFMTTCGVMATLYNAAEAAAELGGEPEFQDRCRREALALRTSLPQSDGAFVPYPGCRESSVALCTGLYPYAVIPTDDPRQLKAMDHLLSRIHEFGNMYPIGSNLCTWYAMIITLALLKLNRRAEAEIILQQTAKNTGCFGEIFEILELDYRPYFGTAEGAFLEAANKIYVHQSEKIFYQE